MVMQLRQTKGEMVESAFESNCVGNCSRTDFIHDYHDVSVNANGHGVLGQVG